MRALTTGRLSRAGVIVPQPPRRGQTLRGGDVWAKTVRFPAFAQLSLSTGAFRFDAPQLKTPVRCSIPKNLKSCHSATGPLPSPGTIFLQGMIACPTPQKALAKGSCIIVRQRRDPAHHKSLRRTMRGASSSITPPPCVRWMEGQKVAHDGTSVSKAQSGPCDGGGVREVKARQRKKNDRGRENIFVCVVS